MASVYRLLHRMAIWFPHSYGIQLRVVLLAWYHTIARIDCHYDAFSYSLYSKVITIYFLHHKLYPEILLIMISLISHIIYMYKMKVYFKNERFLEFRWYVKITFIAILDIDCSNPFSYQLKTSLRLMLSYFCF